METLNPVVVVEVKATSNEDVFQVQLEQIFEKEVTTQASLLSFTMAGATNFNSNTKVKRVAFQNFSKAQIQNLGIVPGKHINACPGIERAKIVIKESLTPRTWVDKVTGEIKSQAPKTAGKDGEVLTKDGMPIYRDTALAINKMSFDDVLIPHNNVIAGSSVPKITLETVEDKPGQVGDIQI